MDPDANWEEQQRILATNGSRSRLRDLRGALNTWIRNGGFPPSAWGGKRTPPTNSRAIGERYTIVFITTGGSFKPRDIGREELGYVSKTKARAALLSRLRAAMKAESLVNGAYLQITS